MSDLIGGSSRWVVEGVYALGYPGVFALIALSNVPLPIPSEVVLPLAGFLVGEGRFHSPWRSWLAVREGLSGQLDQVREEGSEMVGRRIESGILLLRDLRKLANITSEVSINWVILGQGAQARTAICCRPSRSATPRICAS